MKDEKNVLKSRRACLNQIRRFSIELSAISNHCELNGDVSKRSMAKMRDLAESIVQATHEYSAYSNVAETYRQ